MNALTVHKSAGQNQPLIQPETSTTARYGHREIALSGQRENPELPVATSTLETERSLAQRPVSTSAPSRALSWGLGFSCLNALFAAAQSAPVNITSATSTTLANLTTPVNATMGAITSGVSSTLGTLTPNSREAQIQLLQKSVELLKGKVDQLERHVGNLDYYYYELNNQGSDGPSGLAIAAFALVIILYVLLYFCSSSSKS